VVEVGFQRLRSKEQDGGNQNKAMSCKARWARLIDSKVPSEDHAFEELPWASVPAQRGEHWMDVGDLFSPSSKQLPEELKQIVSNARTPAWHSPSPLMVVQQIVELDMYMQHHFVFEGRWSECDSLWMCVLMEGPYLVRNRTVHSEKTWFFSWGDGGEGLCMLASR